MNVVEKLAKFVTETNFERLPTEAVSCAKKAMLDTLGVTFSGSVEPAGRIITNFVKKIGGNPVAGVIGGKIRTSSPNAALANGIMAHCLDYDDVGAHTQGHPSCILLPTVLALGEELNASGKEIITAYILGLEVWARISIGMPRLHFKGWHPTSVFGTMGAAVAASKLLKLSLEQTMMALGLAGSQAAGTIRNNGTMTKPFHAGNAARSGVVTAMLVKDGFTATEDILSGPISFPVCFYGQQEVNVSKMAQNIGAPFAVLSPGIGVKKYPSCYATHRSIDAMLHLSKEYDINPTEVETVDCSVPPRSVKILFYTNPHTGLEGKFSMQFAMAVALTDHKVGLAQFTDEKAQDPLIKDLVKRVTIRVHHDWVEGQSHESRPDVVTVRLKNGKQYSHEVATPKGHADVPLTWDELLAKYRECAKLVLDDNDIERSIELLASLEKLENIKELMKIGVGI